MGKVENMRCAQAVLHTYLITIYPKGSFPMAALNKQFQLFVIPGCRNIHCFLVPGGAFVIFYGLKPEGNFNISLAAVFGIFGFYKPGGIYNVAYPGRIDVNIISL